MKIESFELGRNLHVAGNPLLVYNRYIVDKKENINLINFCFIICFAVRLNINAAQLIVLC